MCDFITAVLPAKSNLDELTRIFLAHGRALQPLENASIQRQLRPQESYFLTTLGMCDCGTVLGCETEAEERRANEARALERKVKKWKQQGWGAAKIESWLSQRRKPKAHSPTTEGDSLARWVRMLEASRASGAAAYVGLLVHQYDGSLSGEIHQFERQHVRIADVTETYLAQMRRDVLYEFRV